MKKLLSFTARHTQQAGCSKLKSSSSTTYLSNSKKQNCFRGRDRKLQPIKYSAAQRGSNLPGGQRPKWESGASHLYLVVCSKQGGTQQFALPPLVLRQPRMSTSLHPCLSVPMRARRHRTGLSAPAASPDNMGCTRSHLPWLQNMGSWPEPGMLQLDRGAAPGERGQTLGSRWTIRLPSKQSTGCVR